eukprot:scaffold14927_cov133-Skeletonema_marinoi.AAC.5
MNIFKPSSSAYLLHSLDEADGYEHLFWICKAHHNIKEVGVSSIFNSSRDIHLYFALDWYASLLALEDKIYSNIAQY